MSTRPLPPDIVIARESKMLPIEAIAAKLGVAADDLEHYGKYKAKVSFIDPRIDAASQLFRVKLLLDNPNHEIKAGMSGLADFSKPVAVGTAP